MSKTLRLIDSFPARSALLIGAYYLGGRISLLLAISAGFASPVWPAAGIALGAVLLGGMRYVPVVFVAAFITNLLIAFEGGGNLLSANSLFVATSIATGATLQASLAAWLIWSATALTDVLDRERDVALLLLLGGPISCVVCATFGVGSLYLVGWTAGEEFLFTWSTWWVGDTIGVLTVTPVMLLLLLPQYAPNRRLLVLAPSVFVLSALIVVFAMARNREQQALEDKFAAITQTTIAKARNQSHINDEILWSLRRYFDASHDIDRQTFATLTQGVLEKHKQITAIYWAPIVPPSQREQFEEQVRRTGLPTFRISKPLLSEATAAASEFPHAPILYCRSLTDIHCRFGTDLYATRRIRPVLEAARDKGGVLASHAVDLPNTPRDDIGVILSLPVFDSQTQINAVADRRQYLRGFVFAVIRLEDFANNILGNEIETFANLYLYDATLNDQQVPLFNVKHTEASFYYRELIDVAGRRWALEFTPTQRFLKQQRSWGAWIVLIGGLLVVGLIQMFLLSLTARTEIIRRLVDDKTARLLERETQLGNILKTAPYGILVLDSSGIIQLVNDVLLNIFGYQRGELERASVDKILEHDAQGLYRQIIDVAERMQTTDVTGEAIEILGKRKDGTTVPIEVRFSNSTLPAGEMQIVVSVQDISTRKQNEKDRETLIEKLTESNKELERFAYVCSHDLQEPLRTIGSFADRLQIQLKRLDINDDTSNQLLVYLREGAIRAQHLITDVLAYSGIERDGAATEAVDLEELVVTVRKQLAETLRVRNGEIISTGLPTVTGNRTRLLQLLQNLINNGLKYQPAGAKPRVHLSARDLGAYWEITVRDNGIGIAQDHCDKIFDVFQRLHRNDEYPGTGVGLSICKRVVQLHGGNIWVESAAGEGASFKFTIAKRLN